MRPNDTSATRDNKSARRSDTSADQQPPDIPRLKIGGHRFYIPSAERDRRLLPVDKWPEDAASFLEEHAPSAQWKVRGKHLFRHITVEDERAEDGAGETPKEHHLWEALLRFPDSSIYHGLPQKPFRVRQTMAQPSHDEGDRSGRWTRRSDQARLPASQWTQRDQ